VVSRKWLYVVVCLIVIVFVFKLLFFVVMVVSAIITVLFGNLLTAITSRAATLISASSKGHVTIEYHVMCLVFCMYSTLNAVQYGEILLS